MKINVSSIQRGCVFDGSGIRTTVFLKGCSLRCPWCCNPETWSQQKYLLDEEKCLFYRGIASNLCVNCTLQGGADGLDRCRFNASRLTSKLYDLDDLLELICADLSVMKASNGGVTFSGGEPLLQASQLEPLLHKIKSKGIDVAFETTLVAPIENLTKLLNYVDEYIIDLKMQPQMLLNDNDYFNHIKETISLIPSTIRKTYRMVFVNEVEGVKEIVAQKLKVLNINDVEILKVHNMAENKYKKLGMKFLNHETSNERLYQFSKYLMDKKIHTTILSI